MRKFSATVMYVFFTLISTNLIQAKETNWDEIVKKSDELRSPMGNNSIHTRMKYYKGENLEADQLVKVSIKDKDHSLIKFLEPARMKGRVMLMTQDSIWIYIVGTKNPIRLTPEQRLLGQASNGDIARLNFAVDYSAKGNSIVNVNGKKCHFLNLTAKRPEVAYSKIDFYVEISSNKPVKAVYYAKSGRLLKEAFFTDFSVIDGKIRLVKMVIIDKVKDKEKTILEYSNFKEERLPDSYFQKNYLERVK